MDMNEIMDSVPDEIKALLNDEPAGEAVEAEKEVSIAEEIENILENDALLEKDSKSDAIISSDTPDLSDQPAVETKSEVELYIDSLGDDRAKDLTRYALQTDPPWNYDLWKSGKGKSAELWVYTEPYIKTSKEQSSLIKEQKHELKKLKDLLYGVTRDSASNTKEQAEALIKDANARLQWANENKDWDEGQAAYQQLDQAKKALADAEKKLKTVSEEPEQSNWQATPEYVNELQRAGKAFGHMNREWFYEFSPNYSPEKYKQACELEQKILKEHPGIDPDLLYTRLQLEIDKSSKPAVPETPSAPAVRKPAIENTSSVRSAEYKSTGPSKVDAEILDILFAMERESPTKAQRTITASDYKKMKGIK